jgi:hypothetical protein
MGCSGRKRRVIGLGPLAGDRTRPHLERRHRSLRQRVAAIRRRSAPAGQGEAGWRQPRVLCQVCHNFVRAPASFRQP